MKDYPSIPRSFREISQAYIFDKLDGSNCRSEFGGKGWTKHGKRNGLIDSSNPHLTIVPELFEKTLAEPLTKIATDNKWKSLIVFYEFWGEKSIGGNHTIDDPKFLTLFDAVPDKKGFMSPEQFRKIFEDKVPTAKFLGIENWNRSFLEKVRNNEIEGITFEGVVAKKMISKNETVRAKAKTQNWIDKIMEIHGKAGLKIVES